MDIAVTGIRVAGSAPRVGAAATRVAQCKPVARNRPPRKKKVEVTRERDERRRLAEVVDCTIQTHWHITHSDESWIRASIMIANQ